MAPLQSVLAMTSAFLLSAAPTRVLFVGNSLTYMHDLPRQFQNVAKSLGDEVEYEQSTIGGCTLLAQGPEGDLGDSTRHLLEQDWDFIVLNDHSLMATVKKAREVYLKSAVKAFASQRKQAKIVLFMTWGYHSGLLGSSCPEVDVETGCFPFGPLRDLTVSNCYESGNYHDTVNDFPCMGYSVARGYLDAKEAGADLVAPSGLAWQVVRGVESIPPGCKDAIDRQYSKPAPLQLPLHVSGGADPDLLLYIRTSETDFDKHQNTAGCYLNALTIYATIFGKSPLGAAAPDATWGLEDLTQGAWPDPEITSAQLETMQKAAAGVVKQCGSSCGFPPSPPPSCTQEDGNPYEAGQHIACCGNLSEVVRVWDRDGRNYYKCQSPSAFELRAKLHPNMCLSFGNAELGPDDQEHTWVHLWTCTAGNRDTRLWKWGSNGEIRNVHSDKCLDVDSNGGFESGTKVQVFPCTGWAGQLWEMRGSKIRNPHSGKCLDMDSHGNFADGTDVQIYDCSGWDGQQFEQDPVPSATVTATTILV
jgi:hypothetical protein